jgi:hypothetical protein
MANRGSRRRVLGVTHAKHAANDDELEIGTNAADLPQAGSPANDNPSIDDLPACLEVTEEEVRLLHRFLGRQILALFG